MMLGIGIDVVQIPRIAELVAAQGDKFAQRILAPQEITLSKKYKDAQYIAFLARRFAAKEAVAKALGTGIGQAVAFQDIIVLKEESGAPVLMRTPKLDAALRARFPAARDYALLVSLSDDYPIAIAMATISAEIAF